MKDEMEKYKRVLSLRDQLALEELFSMASRHTAEVQFTSSPFPDLVFMAAMTLEMHKEMMEMKGRVSNGEAK
jgi:hypothetical protein